MIPVGFKPFTENLAIDLYTMDIKVSQGRPKLGVGLNRMSGYLS